MTGLDLAVDPRRHLLSAGDLNRMEALALLDRSEAFLPCARARDKKLTTLKGRTLVNLFFENSTRTLASFELAGKRMSADTVNMAVRHSSVAKGETLLDTAATLNAMGPDILVVRHASSGAAALLARKVDGAVINAGDGSHEHPTQALLDALTLRRAFGGLEGLNVAICGDILHSRVARSNVILLSMLGARVRLIAPPTLMPADVEMWGCETHNRLEAGIAGADAIMMLRLQLERMDGAYVPSPREYFRFYGLDAAKLALAAPGARVLHPGPMNRGVEIDSEIADDPAVSLIADQVEAGVAVRMAVLETFAGRAGGSGQSEAADV